MHFSCLYKFYLECNGYMVFSLKYNDVCYFAFITDYLKTSFTEI